MDITSILNTIGRGALALIFPGLFLAVGVIGAEGGEALGAVPWFIMAAFLAGSITIPQRPKA